MPTLSIAEVQARLPELIDQLQPGEELVITRNDQPVAKLAVQGARSVPVPGWGQGMVIIHTEDDEHLRDFAEYMPRTFHS
ncbi:type II toxin-antitoxin system Phd/YefM family antitoxin [Anatilimnocola floriformis]|uniref:type II toxin-antitoxin system Phd/YefM family antitoxin n=1 Tax=Anatilimnocola floriformis TaxID=2948575 RepID=UPI0020C4DA3F|nr:type II toxin-antitoxin system Phd/YefM family antitoxin [Anatilimnocola floriformis]